MRQTRASVSSEKILKESYDDSHSCFPVCVNISRNISHAVFLPSWSQLPIVSVINISAFPLPEVLHVPSLIPPSDVGATNNGPKNSDDELPRGMIVKKVTWCRKMASSLTRNTRSSPRYPLHTHSRGHRGHPSVNCQPHSAHARGEHQQQDID